MSWAAHNPEQYDEFIRKGILHWLDTRIDKYGFVVPGEWLQGYEALIEVIQGDPQMSGLYDELVRLSSVEISATEREYFSGLVDQAKDRVIE